MDDRPQFAASYRIGIEQIDQQHQRLFEIAARVHDSLDCDGHAAESVVRGLVADLLDYTATHFASEEALMATAGYPLLDAHRQQHRNLLAQARDMEMRTAIGDRYVPVELNRFLYRWLVDHIQASDKKFGDFVAARPR